MLLDEDLFLVSSLQSLTTTVELFVFIFKSLHRHGSEPLFNKLLVGRVHFPSVETSFWNPSLKQAETLEPEN